MDIPWTAISLSSFLISTVSIRVVPQYVPTTSYLGTFLLLFSLQLAVAQAYRMILWPFFLTPLRHLPTPKGATWYNGHAAPIIREPSAAPMARWVDEVPNDGLIYYRFIFNADRILVASPKAIGEVLVQKSYDFVKPSFLRTSIAQILGVGILLAEGDEHKQQRKNLMPAFAFRHVQDLYPEFWSISRHLVNTMTTELERLSKAASGETKSDPVLDVANWTSRATLDIIGSAGMGHDFNSTENPDNELAAKYREIFEPTGQARVMGLISLFIPGWILRALPIKRNDTIRQAASTIRRICREIINETRTRMSSEKKRTTKDIVSVAIESGVFTDDNLVNQMMTFLAAGHETTATAMTWAIYELCRRPELQVSLREEVRANLPSPDDTEFQLSSTALDKLPFLHAVCNEVLRTRPPVALTIREAAVNTSILGQYIPAGTKVVLPPAAINMSTKLWGPDAKLFKPERWLQPGHANTGGATSNYAYMTFLHGPRSCIGQQFAKAEFAALLAAMVGRFNFELEEPDKEITLQAGLTARPRGGMPVRTKQQDLPRRKEFVVPETGQMGPPPAKRQRRLVVLTSEDEGEEQEEAVPEKRDVGRLDSTNSRDKEHHKTRALPTRLHSKHESSTRRTKTPPTKSSAPSPKKPPSKTRTVRKAPKASSLDTYFSAADRAHGTQRSSSQTDKPGKIIEEEDFIEDDSFDEELRKLSDHRKTIKIPDGRDGALPQSQTDKNDSKRLPGGSQVFRKLTNGAVKVDKDKKIPAPLSIDTRPWADRFGPTSVEELAVHKRKVADVKEWVQGVLEGRLKKRMLILKGASGIGKTATVSTLAVAMGFGILEWTNPTVSEFSSDNYLSTLSQFEDFLARSGKFTSLHTQGSDTRRHSDTQPPSEDARLGLQKKIILVEEFPNLFTSSTTALQSFRNSILRHLSAVPAFGDSADSSIPLILIITESPATTTTSLTDTFTAHRLLGPSILAHPATSTIEFNSIAPTFITKALNHVIQKEARNSGRRRVPGPEVLKCLSEAGDVRSAIGSLEFLCVKGQHRGGDDDEWGGRVASKGKKDSATASAMTAMEKRSLELVSQREASLGLFHAVGKVVYNKREGERQRPMREEFTVQPPGHLAQHVRLKAPDVNPDDLLDETGTDTSTFIAALHENYVLSCSGDSFTDTLNACIDDLSDSEILLSSQPRGKYQGYALATESMRQEELAFAVAVRGTLFSLPSPVHRGGGGSKVGAARGDAYKMFYPTSLRLGRQMVEVDAAIDQFVLRRQGAGGDDGRVAGGGEDDVLAWARRSVQPLGLELGSSEDDGGGVKGGACSTESKAVMVMEQLPFMALIERCRAGYPNSYGEELERITNVKGKAIPGLEDDSVVEDGTANTRPTGKGALTLLPGKKTTAPAIEEEVGKLYLSDDDIVD
ncbi:MAG: hypothetical protein Q9212_001387 [Teloschistes hypoglaucus]